MDEVIDSVKRGGTISEPLKGNPVFPMMVSQMVAVGESTGELDWMLAKLADFRGGLKTSRRLRDQCEMAGFRRIVSGLCGLQGRADVES